MYGGREREREREPLHPPWGAASQENETWYVITLKRGAYQAQSKKRRVEITRIVGILLCLCCEVSLGCCILRYLSFES